VSSTRSWNCLCHVLFARVFPFCFSAGCRHSCSRSLADPGQAGAVFGAVFSQPLQRHSVVYGDMRTFLFTFLPAAAIYRPSGLNQNIQWVSFAYWNTPFHFLARFLSLEEVTCRSPKCFVGAFNHKLV